MRRITPLITAPTMSTPDTPAPQWAVEAAKEIFHPHPLSIEMIAQTIPVNAAIIASHAPNWIAPKAEDHPIGFPVHPFTTQPTAPTAQPEQPAATGTPVVSGDAHADFMRLCKQHNALREELTAMRGLLEEYYKHCEQRGLGSSSTPLCAEYRNISQRIRAHLATERKEDV